MKTRHICLVLAVSAFVITACASGGSGSGNASQSSGGGSGAGGYPAGYSAAPAGTPLAGIALNTNEYDVRKALGEPDRANAYMTGKAWIPFYFGSDVARTDWFYSGQGRVVFSRNRYTGALKVIRVLYNADEP